MRCVRSRFARRPPSKLNTHKLLEVYRHIIALYGNALFLSIMNFKAKHDLQKATLTRQKHSKSHISAIYNILGREWIQRVSDT